MTPRTTRQKAGIAAAVASIAAGAEGIRQVAYYDPPGILTVCYGSTTDVQAGKVYSMAECKARLDADAMKAVETVERCAPGLPDNVLIAFADATFNLGPKIACDTTRSTAARMLKAGDLTGACNQLPRWNKASIGGVMVPLRGLTNRRALERDICLSTPPGATTSALAPDLQGTGLFIQTRIRGASYHGTFRRFT